MIEFDVIEAGFQNIDETINFGARAVAENQNLYEICTSAVISTSQTKTVLENVHVKSCFQDDKIFFAINNILRVMRDREFSEELFSFKLPSRIDNFCVSSSGQYLVICTQDGNVVIKDLITDKEESEEGELNLNVYEEINGNSEDTSFVIGCFENENDNFYIVNSKGLIRRLYLEDDINGNFKSEVVLNLQRHVNSCCLSYPNLCLEGSNLMMVDLESKNVQLDDPMNIKKIYPVGTKFLILTTTGDVYVVSSLTLFVFPINVGHVLEDLVVLKDVKNSTCMQLVGVTQGSADQQSQLKLFTYPDFDVIYSINLNNTVHLMDIEGLTEEVIFFSEIRNGSSIEELRLQYVCEADPILRVERLIRKQLFEEAEAFGKTFNLDPNIVTKAKIQHIVNKLVCTSDDINELLKLFQDLNNDHLFKLNCCHIVDCETSEDTRRLLHYGAFMDINVRDCDENRDNPTLDMKHLFVQKLFRFDIYMAICDNFNNSKWISFWESDIIDEMKNFLKNDCFEEAMIIYSRLDCCTIVALSDDRVEEILSISNKLPGEWEGAFLKIFIPITLKYRPDTLSIFIQWVYKRIYDLENQFYFDFPEIGIKFLEDMIKLLNLDEPVRKQSNVEELVKRITDLSEALNDIQTLKNNFAMKISLSEYLTSPDNTIRSLLSAEMDVENLEHLLREFVCPFILKNGIDRDIILLEEIKNLLKYEEEYWVHTVEMLITFISSVDTKLEVIKDVLDKADLPWCDTVKNIARQSFKFATDSQLAKDIRDMLENEERLIILHKYSINRKHITTLQDSTFYFNRIMYLNKDSAIEDIHKLCRDDKERLEADLIISENLIKKEQYLEAMRIIEQGDSDRLAKSLFDFCYNLVCHLPDAKITHAYYKMMNLVSKEVKSPLNFEIMKSMYRLHHEFDISAKSAELYTRTGKLKLLEILVDQMPNLLRDDPANLDKLFTLSKSIASCLSITSDDVIIKYIKNSDNYKYLIDLGERICETCTSSKHLSVYAIFLFKYTKRESDSEMDETVLDFTEPLYKDEDYILGIELAIRLAVKAMMNATVDDFLVVMETLRWVDSCQFLVSSAMTRNTANLYNYVYLLKGPSVCCSSLQIVKRIFNSYLSYKDKSRSPNTGYLTYFTDNSLDQDQFHKEIKDLSGVINVFIREGQHFTAYSLIRTLNQALIYDAVGKNSVASKLNSVVFEKLLPQTLNLVLSSRHIDRTLFFNLMLFYERNFEKPLNNYLQTYKRHPIKLALIAQVGLELLKLFKEKAGQANLENIINVCKWWNRAKSHKLDYNMFFKCNAETRFKELVYVKQMDLNNLVEYCQDFQVDVESCYMKYLRMLLLNWKPDVEIKVDIENKRNAIVKNDENELLNMCWPVVERIQNKSELYNILDKIWSLVNFYYYEVYLTLIYLKIKLRSEITNQTLSTNRALLTFLKNYVRVSPPTRSEIEQWHGAFPMAAFIEPLSEFRLPLSSTFLSTNIWNIIKPEVSLKTYKEWFELTDILRDFLNKQDICTYAINSVLASGVFDKTDSNEWDLYPKHENLIAEVDNCASHIEDLERATAAVYTLMCGIPFGADKVNFARLSLKYAQIYKDSQNDEDVYQKVKQRYFNYSVMHILHKYQLADRNYLELVAQPIDLIISLYGDPRIPSKMVNIATHCPDINRAVNELTELFGLNAKKVKYNILADFLKTHADADLNCTEFVQNYKKFDSNEMDCLKRACYICSDSDLTFWQKTLLKIGLQSDLSETEHYSMIFKGNALRCFYYISDIETIEKMTEMCHYDFLTLVDKILVISKINDLGINITDVEQLNKHTKKTLKALARLQDPLAIKSMASLCKIYNIEDIKYWVFIVNKAIQFNMIDELTDYVSYLKGRCITPAIEEAWRLIIKNAFSIPDGINSSEGQILDVFVRGMHLLQTCPIPHALDFDTYIKKFIAHGRLEFAAVLLQYIPEKKNSYLEQLLSSRTLIEDLKALKATGIIGVQKAMRMFN